MRLASQIADAILAGQEQILLADGSTLELPAGQKRGTEYQKQSYANQKAIEIVEQLQKKKDGK